MKLIEQLEGWPLTDTERIYHEARRSSGVLKIDPEGLTPRRCANRLKRLAQAHSDRFRLVHDERYVYFRILQIGRRS